MTMQAQKKPLPANTNPNSAVRPREEFLVKEKPAKKERVQPTLKDHLHVLDVLQRAREASVEVHSGAGVVVIDRMVKDLTRKMRRWAKVTYEE
jgi:hypothetical protein